MSVRAGLFLGFAQALALIPGVSRSGMTITAACFMGFDRDRAARNSFLIWCPAAGALFELRHIGGAPRVGGRPSSPAPAFGLGYAAIAGLLRYLANAQPMTSSSPTGIARDLRARADGDRRDPRGQRRRVREP